MHYNGTHEQRFCEGFFLLTRVFAEKKVLNKLHVSDANRVVYVTLRNLKHKTKSAQSIISVPWAFALPAAGYRKDARLTVPVASDRWHTSTPLLAHVGIIQCVTLEPYLQNNEREREKKKRKDPLISEQQNPLVEHAANLFERFRPDLYDARNIQSQRPHCEKEGERGEQTLSPVYGRISSTTSSGLSPAAACIVARRPPLRHCQCHVRVNDARPRGGQAPRPSSSTVRQQKSDVNAGARERRKMARRHDRAARARGCGFLPSDQKA